VEAHVAPGATDRLKMNLVINGAGTPELVQAYFGHMERQINLETLHRVWRADLPEEDGSNDGS
jgi:hypothetical protein